MGKQRSRLTQSGSKLSPVIESSAQSMRYSSSRSPMMALIWYEEVVDSIEQEGLSSGEREYSREFQENPDGLSCLRGCGRSSAVLLSLRFRDPIIYRHHYETQSPKSQSKPRQESKAIQSIFPSRKKYQRRKRRVLYELVARRMIRCFSRCQRMALTKKASVMYRYTSAY